MTSPGTPSVPVPAVRRSESSAGPAERECSVAVPFTPSEPFRPAWGAAGPQRQTLLAHLLRRPRAPGLRRERVDTHDGDFLDLDWLEADADAPHVLVLHGLEGAPGSGYVRATLNENRPPRLGSGGDGLAELQRRVEPRPPDLLLGGDGGPALRLRPDPRGRSSRPPLRHRLLARGQRTAEAARRDGRAVSHRRRGRREHALRPRGLRPGARCPLGHRGDLPPGIPPHASSEGAAEAAQCIRPVDSRRRRSAVLGPFTRSTTRSPRPATATATRTTTTRGPPPGHCWIASGGRCSASARRTIRWSPSRPCPGPVPAGRSSCSARAREATSGSSPAVSSGRASGPRRRQWNSSPGSHGTEAGERAGAWPVPDRGRARGTVARNRATYLGTDGRARAASSLVFPLVGVGPRGPPAGGGRVRDRPPAARPLRDPPRAGLRPRLRRELRGRARLDDPAAPVRGDEAGARAQRPSRRRWTRRTWSPAWTGNGCCAARFRRRGLGVQGESRSPRGQGKAGTATIPDLSSIITRLAPGQLHRVQVRRSEFTYVFRNEGREGQGAAGCRGAEHGSEAGGSDDVEATIENLGDAPRPRRGCDHLRDDWHVEQEREGDALCHRRYFRWRRASPSRARWRSRASITTDAYNLVDSKSDVAFGKGTLDSLGRFGCNAGKLTGAVQPVIKNAEVKAAKEDFGTKVKAWAANLGVDSRRTGCRGETRASTVVPIEGNLTDSAYRALADPLRGVPERVRPGHRRGVLAPAATAGGGATERHRAGQHGALDEKAGLPKEQPGGHP